MKGNSIGACEWITKAKNDLISSQILFDERGPTDTLCFHCQQAVEKYLKDFLTYHRVRFEKIHDLTILAKLCAKKEKGFSDFGNEYKILNSYYIESRYPPDILTYSWREARSALEIAKQISSFIKGQLSF